MNLTSAKLGKSLDKSQHYEDAASVVSETSYASDGTWISHNQNFFTSGLRRFGLARPGDPTIDDDLKNLYMDGDTLEHKCKTASSGGNLEEEQCRRNSFHWDDLSKMNEFGIKKIKSAQEVIDSLHEGYFDERFDPIHKQLVTISQWSDAEMMEKFMATIEDTDTDKDMVLGKLSYMIECNYGEIMSCMRDVNAIDLGLTRTGIILTNSRRKLRSGKVLLIDEANRITLLKSRRDRLVSVHEILKQMKLIKDLYTSIFSYLAVGDVGRAADHSYQLLTILQHEAYDEIKAIQFYAEGTQKCLPHIRHRADKLLNTLTCRRFNVSEYSTIIHSYVLLDFMEESLGVAVTMSIGDDDENGHVFHDDSSCMHGLGDRILRYHINDVYTSIQTIILEFLYQQNVKTDYSEMMLEELYECISVDVAIPLVMRCYEMLTNVLYTNSLILQWHMYPFDERNCDSDFLHSNHEDEPVESSDCTETVDRNLLLQQNYLGYAKQSLLTCRQCLVDEIQVALSNLLRHVPIGATNSMENFIIFVWASKYFMKLCGCDFMDIIHIKSSEYISSIHLENVQLFIQMLESEPYQSVPIKLNEMGGIIGFIKMNSMRHNNEMILVQGLINESLRRKKKLPNFDSLLHEMYHVGNPFSLQHTEDNSLIADLLQFIIEDDMIPHSRKQLDKLSAVVITQSALNGLLKFAGNYLQLMHVLPVARMTIVNNLFQFFDYYLATMYVGFIAADERQRLSSKQPKAFSPPPIQAKDFEALIIAMQRILNDQIIYNKSESKVHKTIQTPSCLLYQDLNHHYALKERIVAAESCFFAAKILTEIKPKMIKMIPENCHLHCETYIGNFQLIAGQLRSLIYRSMCPALLKYDEVLHELVENSLWDSRKMLEEPHEWVDILSNNCKEIWDYMCVGEDFADASTQVREQVCQAAFDLVLEGYSRVKKCSTEGRASMTMDVSSLQTALEAIHPCRPPRGKTHVDTYVKASYLSDDEIVHWVHQNYLIYAYRHLHGLLCQTFSSVMKKKKLKDALNVLDALYDENDKDESKLSNMLTQRLR